MPVPGVERNPDHLTAFVRWHRRPLVVGARSQVQRVRVTAQERGTIRRLWRGLALYASGQGGYGFSWSANGFNASPHVGRVTTPLHYMISTRDVTTAGNQRSNPLQRPTLSPSVSIKTPRTVLTGNVDNRPVLRVRVPSFGSRIPALNQDILGTVEQ